MNDLIRVLVYGSVDSGSSDFHRLGMYRERLARLGVEMRMWSDFNDYSIRLPAGYSGRLTDALRDGVAEVDREPIDWADVILFRRWYSASPCCGSCDAAGSAEMLAAHSLVTGHRPGHFDQLLPLLLSTIEAHPELLRGRALVYETDDDMLAAAPRAPFHRRLVPNRPIVEWMLRRADLVTVATPVLARMAGRYNHAVRVVRNAIDPAWYERPGAAPELEGDPRILYTGGLDRSRDYEVCREAVDWVAAGVPGARRFWLGSDDATVRALVDEAQGHAESGPASARALTAIRPGIGLAPVVDDDFGRAQTELRYLEYTMAGAATVASRTMGDGPYDFIRDGVDGILAGDAAEWRSGLERLAGSRTLREEIAGRARELVLAEYDPDARAEEWADAYRWAAEHGGSGALSGHHLQGAVVNPLARRTANNAAAALAYRRRARRQATAESERLIEARHGRDVCWPDGADSNPLVSVVIPTYNRGRMVVDRAIGSVIQGTYDNFEIVVVGDHATPDTIEAVLSVGDPRIRFEDLPARSPRPDDPELAWLISGSAPYNRCLDLARGQWIAPLPDDDEFTPDHIRLLLDLAIENRLEFVYARSLMQDGADGTWFEMGDWPPRLGGFAAGSMLYSAGLSFMKLETECWLEEEPNDWNLWRRMEEAGVRMGFVDHVVFRHYMEGRHRLVSAA